MAQVKDIVLRDLKKASGRMIHALFIRCLGIHRAFISAVCIEVAAEENEIGSKINSFF